MPYASVAELPKVVRTNIPSKKGQRVWLRVFNAAHEKYGEEAAFRTAYSAVKKLQKDVMVSADVPPTITHATRPRRRRVHPTSKALEELLKHPAPPPHRQKSHGGGMAFTATTERAWDGTQKETKTKLSKNETGEIAEKATVVYLRSKGLTDAGQLNTKKQNYALDVMAGNTVYEVKGGLVSNGKAAQQWRATIGQPGKKEAARLKTMAPAQKRALNDRKRAGILKRKRAALREVAKATGQRVKGKTMTSIIDPDRKIVDLYEHKGFHLRIGWKSPEAKRAYVGSFKYE